MGSIFHDSEDVREEGLKVFYKYLNLSEKELKVSSLILDKEDVSLNEIFQFKVKHTHTQTY